MYSRQRLSILSRFETNLNETVLPTKKHRSDWRLPNTTNLARIIVDNLDRFGFTGKVFPVGTKKGKLGDRNILTSINEIEETPDLAVILVPGRFVPDTLWHAAKKESVM